MADGGKNAKYGRNKLDAARYERENRLVKNKAKSLARHLKRMGLPDSYRKGYTPPGFYPGTDTPAKGIRGQNPISRGV